MHQVLLENQDHSCLWGNADFLGVTILVIIVVIIPQKVGLSPVEIIVQIDLQSDQANFQGVTFSRISPVVMRNKLLARLVPKETQPFVESSDDGAFQKGGDVRTDSGPKLGYDGFLE